MKSSGQAVLIALETWLEERFKRVYTYKDLNTLINIELKVVKNNDPDHLKEAKKVLFSYFSADNLANKMFCPFSEGFSNLEDRIFKGKGLGKIANMPPGYISDYIKSYNKIKEIVDDLRTKVDNRFPDALSKEDIDNSARKCFPRGGLVDFFDKIYQASFLIRYHQEQIKGASVKELYGLLESYNKTKSQFKDIYRRMFSDLYENIKDKR